MTAVDVATQFLRRNRRAERQIITPEGVPLTVELADYGERATAFLIDLTIWLIASAAVLLLLVFTPFHNISGVILISLLLFTAFVVRNLYFIHFELSWYGATPGKRIVGIRVIDRRGGPLLPSAVIARNLTREVEIFIPLGVLISASAAAKSGAWEYLVLGAWLACFAGLIFFNRDRMRAGDLIAGTVVIVLPRQRLLGDLVETAARFTFADRQLQAYGALELQVLEELLRRPEAPDRPLLLRDVCDRICRKIDWKETVPDAEITLFLRDFYTAQRAYLEREQLFGRRRADKHQAAERRSLECAASGFLIEHRSDLIGVDAFLGDAQVVVEHDQDDVEIRGIDRRADQPEQACEHQRDDPLRRKCDGPDDGRDDEANDHCSNQNDDQDQDENPKNLPAMALGQFGAAPHGSQGPEVFNDARRQSDRPPDGEHDARHDQQNDADDDSERCQNGETDDRPEPRQPTPHGFADEHRSAAHHLESTVEDDRLSDRVDDHPDDERDEPPRAARD